MWLVTRSSISQICDFKYTSSIEKRLYIPSDYVYSEYMLIYSSVVFLSYGRFCQDNWLFSVVSARLLFWQARRECQICNFGHTSSLKKIGFIRPLIELKYTQEDIRSRGNNINISTHLFLPGGLHKYLDAPPLYWPTRKQSPMTSLLYYLALPYIFIRDFISLYQYQLTHTAL